MYVGRIVAVGRTRGNRLVAMYRVSSRSFPNRQTRQIGDSVAVVPKPGFESDIYKNPYLAYNCLRVNEDVAVVGNGTHTDPVFEKLAAGMSTRDALVMALIALDYEHDQYNTPRIAAVVDRRTRRCALGTVRQDALLVQDFALEPGEALYLATYEHNSPGRDLRDGAFEVTSADDACEYVLGKGVFAGLERPISAASAMETDRGFSVAYRDAVPAG